MNMLFQIFMPFLLFYFSAQIADAESGVTDNDALPNPVYELQHGRGLFAIVGGSGCYKDARGQAQARFNVLSGSRIDLFIPAISWIFDEVGLQDTIFNKIHEPVGDDGIHRKLGATTCDLLRSGKHSFSQISLNLHRQSNPPNIDGSVMESSSTLHEHGTFEAQEEWFDERIEGEYSLSCIFHECKVFLNFHSIEDSTGQKETMTSLNLQGTTELAFQGADTDLLACVDNCDAISSNVDVDAEYLDILVRNFDNTDSLVRVDRDKKTAKNTKRGSGGSGSWSGSRSMGQNEKNKGGAEKNKQGDGGKKKDGGGKNKGPKESAKDEHDGGFYVPVPPTFLRPTNPPPTYPVPSSLAIETKTAPTWPAWMTSPVPVPTARPPRPQPTPRPPRPTYPVPNNPPPPTSFEILEVETKKAPSWPVGWPTNPVPVPTNPPPRPRPTPRPPTPRPPTPKPTPDPTKAPSKSPTKDPTSSPTNNPTKAPTSGSPTKVPWPGPTPVPTTAAPSSQPTDMPTVTPGEPTKRPTTKESSSSPTKKPSSSPTPGPTKQPTIRPPTEAPTMLRIPSTKPPPTNPPPSSSLEIQTKTAPGQSTCEDCTNNRSISMVLRNTNNCDSISGRTRSAECPRLNGACELSCFLAGYDVGKECCDYSQQLPDDGKDCQECTNHRTQKMIANGRDCSTYQWGLLNRCGREIPPNPYTGMPGKRSWWLDSSIQFCQYSCWKAGNGYQGKTLTGQMVDVGEKKSQYPKVFDSRPCCPRSDDNDPDLFPSRRPTLSSLSF